MVCTLLVMFMDSGQTARPEKCLLHVMSNLRKRWLDLGLGEVFGENAHSLGFIEAQVGKPRQNIVYVSGE